MVTEVLDLSPLSVSASKGFKKAAVKPSRVDLYIC